MNITEFAVPKTNNVINSLYLKPAEKHEHYLLYINDNLEGKLEKSDIRHFIEVLDSNSIETNELLLNGTRVGCIDFNMQKELIKYLDNKIHK